VSSARRLGLKTVSAIKSISKTSSSVHRLSNSKAWIGTKSAHEKSRSSPCTAVDYNKSTGSQPLRLNATGKTLISPQMLARFLTAIFELSLDTIDGEISPGNGQMRSMGWVISSFTGPLGPLTSSKDAAATVTTSPH